MPVKRTAWVREEAVLAYRESINRYLVCNETSSGWICAPGVQFQQPHIFSTLKRITLEDYSKTAFKFLCCVGHGTYPAEEQLDALTSYVTSEAWLTGQFVGISVAWGSQCWMCFWFHGTCFKDAVLSFPFYHEQIVIVAVDFQSLCGKMLVSDVFVVAFNFI